MDGEASDEGAAMYGYFIEPLDFRLRKLFDDMIAGRYRFSRAADLRYMPFVHRFGRAIPFRVLLETVNRTHREGL